MGILFALAYVLYWTILVLGLYVLVNVARSFV